MKRTIRHFVQLTLGAALAVAAVKAPGQMAVEGKLLFEDDFKTPAEYSSQRQQVADGWTVQVAHAAWKPTSDGVQSVFRSGHMPVLLFECEHPFSNVVIEVEFRFHKEPGTNKNQGAACRISPTNPKLNPNAYSASVWANLDSKDRQPGMVLEHDEWGRAGITTVDHKSATFEPDKWYQVRMELIGNASLATCNGVTVYGTHEKFGLPKTSVALGSGYCLHEFRRFRIYEATPNPKWTAPATEKASSSAANPLYAAWKGQEGKTVTFNRAETISGGAPVPGGNAAAPTTSKVTYTLSEMTAEQAVLKIVRDPNAPAELLSIPAKLSSDDSSLPKSAGKEDLKLGDKIYACTKYTYSSKSKVELGRDGQGLPGNVTVWVADGVPGGIVQRQISLTIRASYFISETMAP